MNILFIYTSEIIPESGGVQRVTKVLGDYFLSQDFNVFYLSYKKKSKKDDQINNHYFLNNDLDLYDSSNVNIYLNLIEKKKIDVVINQAALGGYMAAFCYNAKKYSENVKIVSVIHNSLLGTIDNLTTSNKKFFRVINLSSLTFFLDNKFVKKILLKLYIKKYEVDYNKMYNLSDKVVLLSDSYIKQLKLFVKNINKNKVTSIFNPCTILNVNDIVSHKENELLYVGRVNTAQKRVDLLLDIWQEVYISKPSWKLIIVGDGEELDFLKNKANKMKLKNVFFEGHKNPTPYYKKAKMLCMTSAYEGFPLVLAEAQAFNVMPILFNSFSAVNDIIDDNKNGILVKPFNTKIYAKKINEFIDSYDQNLSIYKKELDTNAKRFSIKVVGQEWIELFRNL